jgi:hypothetical protein
MPAPSSYVPPAMRAKSSPIAKKTALKKEFAMEPSAFPALGETFKKTATRGTPISFSSAAAKVVETPKEVAEEVLPGWVHMRYKDGQIQYKYGKPCLNAADPVRMDYVQSRIILKNRIEREQYDRNWDIERLGDLSEFYGQPLLAELYAALEVNGKEDSDSSSSGVDE